MGKYALAIPGKRTNPEVHLGRTGCWEWWEGIFSAGLMWVACVHRGISDWFWYALVIIMGVLVGLEIPLLMRIVKDQYSFRDVVAHVLTFDYLGAL